MLAEKYIKMYVQGTIDRLDVAFTRFVSSSRQLAIVQTLLPISTAELGQAGPSVRQSAAAATQGQTAGHKGEPVAYEFLPDAKSILEEIVPGLVQGAACSSAFWTRRSASRLRAWLRWAGRPRMLMIS